MADNVRISEVAARAAETKEAVARRRWKRRRIGGGPGGAESRVAVGDEGDGRGVAAVAAVVTVVTEARRWRRVTEV